MTNSIEQLRDVALTSDGGYIFAGNYYTNQPNNNGALLIKTDLYGNTLWQKEIGGSREERILFVKELPGGEYISAGRIYDPPGGAQVNPDFYLVKTTAEGDVIWSKTYGGADRDFLWSATYTLDGGVAMVGHTKSFGAGKEDVYLVKVDANGNLQWTKTFGTSLDDSGQNILQTSTGNFIISGYVDDASKVYLIKTDSTGNLIWSNSYGISGDATASALIQADDGGFVLSGTLNNPGYDVFWLKVDSTGSLLWAKYHTASANGDNIESGVLTDDGGFLFAGERGFGPGDDFYLIKTDANGNIEWTTAHGGSDEDQIHSVKQTPDGGFVCAGQTRSFGIGGGDVDGFMMKTDANGDSGCNALSSNTSQSNASFTVSTPSTTVGSGGTETSYASNAACAYQIDSFLCSNSSSSVEYQFLSTSISTTDVTCAGCIDGSINLTLTGGSGSYAFAWSSLHTTEDISNLAAGLYIVTVTDNYGCSVSDSASVASPVITFQKAIGGTDVDGAFSVQQTNDGGYILGAYGFGTAGVNHKAVLIYTDAYGNMVWQKSYAAASDQHFRYVAQTSDGGYIGAGRIFGSPGAGNWDYYLVRTDDNGDLLWSKTFGGSGDDFLFSARLTSDGGAILVGYTVSYGAGGNDVYLMKVDDSGNVEWAQTFGGGGVDDLGLDVIQTPGGNYVVCGVTSAGPVFSSVYLIKTTSTGSLVWTKAINSNDGDRAESIRLCSDGGFILTGKDFLGQRVNLIRTDSSGNVLWNKLFSETNGERGFTVQQTSEGGFLVGGARETGTSSQDGYLIKTDASGNIEWAKGYGGSSVETIYDIKLTDDSGYIVIGDTRSFAVGESDIYLIKTDSLGESGCNQLTENFSTSAPSLQETNLSHSAGGGVIEGNVQSTTDCAGLVTGSLCSNSSASVSSITWTGNIDFDWFTDGNWNTNNVPEASSNVVIPSGTPTPKILSTSGIAAKANYLTIQSGVQLTVENGVELEMYGDLSNSGTISGTGTLHFKNPCNDQYLTGSSTFFSGIVKVAGGSTLHTNDKLFLESGSSLLHGLGTPEGEGNVIGNISYKQLGQANPIKWNYWSSPVTGANVSILGSRLYYFDVHSAIGTNLDDIREGWMDASGIMQSGIGYISQGGGTVSFAGPPGNAPTGTPITVSVTKNAVTTVGYNFLGNPFPSAISAQLFVDSNIGTMYGSIYLWDDDASGGSDYNFNDFTVWNSVGTAGPNTNKPFDGHIATAQGFFAEKITNGNGSVIFTNSMRTTQNDDFFRLAPIERLWMNIIGPDSAYNETLIAFLHDATDSMDIRYDAKKFFGEDNIAFYSLLDSKSCAIQSFPPLENNRTVQIGVNAGTDGDYVINLKKVETLDETVVILLEDTLSGNIYNLRVDSSHTFHIPKGNDNGRFLLHFNPQMTIATEQEGCAGNDGQIFIEQPGSYTWDFVLTDETDAVIDSITNFTGYVAYSNLAAGKYSLELYDRYGYRVIKNIEVSAKQKVTAGFNVAGNIFYVGDSISFQNVSNGATHYAWDFGDGNVANGIENPVHVYSTADDYIVTQQASNNDCQEDYSSLIHIHENIATEVNVSSPEAVRIFSQSDKIYVRFLLQDAGTSRIQVYDLLGKKIFEDETERAGLFEIPLRATSTTNYLVRVVTSRGDVFNVKAPVLN